jgi:hypothetical protein
MHTRAFWFEFDKELNNLVGVVPPQKVDMIHSPNDGGGGVSGPMDAHVAHCLLGDVLHLGNTQKADNINVWEFRSDN